MSDTQLLAKLQALRHSVEQLNDLNGASPNDVVYSCLLQITNLLDEMYIEKAGE